MYYIAHTRDKGVQKICWLDEIENKNDNNEYNILVIFDNFITLHLRPWRFFIVAK